jgi:hypothetical protein
LYSLNGVGLADDGAALKSLVERKEGMTNALFVGRHQLRAGFDQDRINHAVPIAMVGRHWQPKRSVTRRLMATVAERAGSARPSLPADGRRRCNRRRRSCTRPELLPAAQASNRSTTATIRTSKQNKTRRMPSATRNALQPSVGVVIRRHPKSSPSKGRRCLDGRPA